MTVNGGGIDGRDRLFGSIRPYRRIRYGPDRNSSDGYNRLCRRDRRVGDGPDRGGDTESDSSCADQFLYIDFQCEGRAGCDEYAGNAQKCKPVAVNVCD